MDEPTYLRALELSDLDRMHAWHNDKELYEMVGGPFRYTSKNATQAWLERKTGYAANSPIADEINLAICIRGENKHIGNIYLHQINWIARNAELRIFIGDPEERSKGYGTSAIRQLLSYAFNDMGLKRVHLGVLTDNPAAEQSYRKIGFSVEGTLRNHVFKQGGWKDVLLMGICVEDCVKRDVQGSGGDR